MNEAAGNELALPVDTDAAPRALRILNRRGAAVPVGAPSGTTVATGAAHDRAVVSRDFLAERVRLVLIAVALLLAALHAWSGRHAMNVDGVSYLDLGDALVQRDWPNAINGHWSPLYALLLGLLLDLTQPSAYWEFAVVHAANFGIFAAALCAFDFLLRETQRYGAARLASSDDERLMPMWLWLALGYSLFLWSSLQLITIAVVTPDLALSGALYLASALVLRIARGAAGWPVFVVLGGVLGLGYLVKAPMFPLAAVFLAVAWVATGASRRSLPSVAVALISFAIVAGPFIAALSSAKGRLTFGESRTLAYAWFVNQIPFRHWQGGNPEQGVPVHPTRRVFERPVAYEFAEPVVGSYPVWFDPSYWYEGIRARWDAREQLDALRVNVRELLDIIVSYVQVTLGLSFAALVAVGGGVWRGIKRLVPRLLDYWVLLVPALVGLAMYLPVSVFPRYIAPFLVLVWVALFAAIRIPSDARARRTVAVRGLGLFAVLSVLIVVEIGPEAAGGLREIVAGETREHVYWEVADGLHRLGVQPGDEVAVVHPEPSLTSWAGTASWARLARVRIVAEIPPEASQDYWTAEEATKRRVQDVFRRTGATAIVAPHVPSGASAGWQPVGGTTYRVFPLPPGDRPPSVAGRAIQ